MVDTVLIHSPKPIECTLPRQNSNRLWVKMICQRRFACLNASTTLEQDIKSRGGCAHVGIDDYTENSALPAQFCCQHKAGLKIVY